VDDMIDSPLAVNVLCDTQACGFGLMAHATVRVLAKNRRGDACYSTASKSQPVVRPTTPS